MSSSSSYIILLSITYQITYLKNNLNFLKAFLFYFTLKIIIKLEINLILFNCILLKIVLCLYCVIYLYISGTIKSSLIFICNHIVKISSYAFIFNVIVFVLFFTLKCVL